MKQVRESFYRHGAPVGLYAAAKSHVDQLRPFRFSGLCFHGKEHVYEGQTHRSWTGRIWSGVSLQGNWPFTILHPRVQLQHRQIGQRHPNRIQRLWQGRLFQIFGEIKCKIYFPPQATPPPKLDHPPKYDPEIYECSGKALGIAILDMTESNPWTRLTCSAYKNLRGVRDWLRKYIKTQAEEQEKEKNAAGNNKIKSAASPSRSLRSATSRRVRTFSASSSSASKKLKAASLKAIPTSPESYRPVSKIARKNSGHQQQSSSHSPRAVKRATSSPGFSRSSLISRPTTANKDKEGKESKRKSSSKALARARSLSTANIVLNAVTNEIFAGPSKSTRSTSRPSSPTSSSVKKRSTRSRPGSPKQSSAARRPISPGHFGGIAKVVSVVKTPKKLRKNKNKIVPKSTAATEAVILTASTPTSTKKSKSPIKRIRRRKSGQNPSSTSGAT